jgi:hypothetical protein
MSNSEYFNFNFNRMLYTRGGSRPPGQEGCQALIHLHYNSRLISKIKSKMISRCFPSRSVKIKRS